MFPFNAHYVKSLGYLFQWMVISVTAGITGSLMVASFFILVGESGRFIQSNPVPFPFWSAAGALFCGLVLYRFSPTASGDGIPSYIRGVLDKEGVYSFRETSAKYGATLTALMTMSIGGMVGPSGRVSAGISSRLAHYLSMTGIIGDHRRTAALCGMAAAIGAIFHSPIGGGIFAVEVLQKADMRYLDLFPAILSSSIAVYLYSFFPFDYPLHFAAPEGIFQSALMPPIVVTSLAAALVGRLYIAVFARFSRLIRKDNGRNITGKLLGGSIVSSLLLYFFSPLAAGNIRGISEYLFHGMVYPVRPLFSGLPFWLMCLIFLTLIVLASSIAIASGISVGMTSPSILAGLFLGAFSAALFRFTPADPEYFYLLVAGFTGLLSSTVNVPVSAAIIAVETFGASYGFCAGVSSVIGFQVNRHHTLYDGALKDTD